MWKRPLSTLVSRNNVEWALKIYQHVVSHPCLSVVNFAAEKIHGKILSGEIDVSNESHGIKVGMAGSSAAAGLPGLQERNAGQQRGGCC